MVITVNRPSDSHYVPDVTCCASVITSCDIGMPGFLHPAGDTNPTQVRGVDTSQAKLGRAWGSVPSVLFGR